MDKLIRLNVQLKDSKAAKESLFQYKLTCHSVNVKSLEDTVRKYLQLAELRVQEAQQERYVKEKLFKVKTNLKIKFRF